MKKKVLLFTLLFFVAICLVNYVIYCALTQKIEGADLNLEARGIETPAKLFLAGYFGLFFGFKYLGDINWVLIPVFFIYLWVVKPKFTREQKALIVVLLFSFALIAVKGYFNQRYQFTLLPFVLFFLFLFTWQIYTKLNNPFYLREIAVIFLLGVATQFTYHTLFGSRTQAHINKIFDKTAPPQPQKQTHQSVFELADYVDSLPTSGNYLVNNMSDFYYYTNKKGYYYWCQDDFLYTKKGIRKLFDKRNTEQLKAFLTDSLNCNYIYTYKSYNPYSVPFMQFLENECSLVAEDRDGKQLYQIND